MCNVTDCFFVFDIAQVIYPIKFYGHVHEVKRSDGTIKCVWEGGEEILAVAYDTPIPVSSSTDIVFPMYLYLSAAGLPHVQHAEHSSVERKAVARV